MTIRWPVICLFALLGTLCAVAPALADAGLCSASATAVNFGTLGVSTLQGATTTGTTTLTCPGGENHHPTWYFCTSIGVGTNSVSQTNRTLKSGANSIAYQLYMDSGYSNSFQYVGTDVYSGAYSYTTGASVPQTIYAKISGSPLSVPPGTYSDSYASGAQAVITSFGNGVTGTPANTCTGYTGANWWNTLSFTVSVTLQASCIVSATSISFGSVALLASNNDTTGTVSVTCTSSTPYKISLGYGNGVGAGAGSGRYMAATGGYQVNYNLYQDSGRSTNWGNNLGVDTVASTGTGADQDFTVYARVPPQTVPAVGYYTDTVVVTVNF
jgi:spore coat protein U-like protein